MGELNIMRKLMTFVVLVLVLVACANDFEVESCPWSGELLKNTNIKIDSWGSCLGALNVAKAGEEASLEACMRQFSYERSAYKTTVKSLSDYSSASHACGLMLSDGELSLSSDEKCAYAVRAYVAYLVQENNNCFGCKSRSLCPGKPKKVEEPSEGVIETPTAPTLKPLDVAVDCDTKQYDPDYKVSDCMQTNDAGDNCLVQNEVCQKVLEDYWRCLLQTDKSATVVETILNTCYGWKKPGIKPHGL